MCKNGCKIACYKHRDLPDGAYFLNDTRDALLIKHKEQNIVLLRLKQASSTIHTDSFECVKWLSQKQAGSWLLKYGSN